MVAEDGLQESLIGQLRLEAGEAFHFGGYFAEQLVVLLFATLVQQAANEGRVVVGELGGFRENYLVVRTKVGDAEQVAAGAGAQVHDGGVGGQVAQALAAAVDEAGEQGHSGPAQASISMKPMSQRSR